MSVEMVHEMYMNVMNRRGSARFDITIAANIAPMPPNANTRPRTPAPRPISTLTTYGTSTSAGPQKIRYASVAARNVPHSHTRVRT